MHKVLAQSLLSMLMMDAVGWGCDCEGNRKGALSERGAPFPHPDTNYRYGAYIFELTVRSFTRVRQCFSPRLSPCTP